MTKLPFVRKNPRFLNEEAKEKKIYWEGLLLDFTEEISLLREEASGMSLGEKEEVLLLS